MWCSKPIGVCGKEQNGRRNKKSEFICAWNCVPKGLEMQKDSEVSLQEPGLDPHSFANYDQIEPVHLDLDLWIDFGSQMVCGNVLTELVTKVDGVESLYLDVRNLAIERVEGEGVVRWSALYRPEIAFGTALQVKFSSPLAKGQKVSVRVYYHTTAGSSGLQWFKGVQTLGKEHPFVFTQFQSILARTVIPCMDTPSVKSPFSAKISVASPLMALVSGQMVLNPDGTPKSVYDPQTDRNTYFYEQTLPVPNYLIAIVAGALKSARIGPRSLVWSEVEILERAVAEFGEHTEAFIQTAERLLGIPYLWGTYNLVMLPPSYAFGGMENVSLTFLNSVLVVGDKSLIDVIAHEIAHSWSGNDATNSSWRDFWLNEGFTMYIERLILGEFNNSEAYRRFQLYLGYKELVDRMESFKNDDPSWTSLSPQIIGHNPDDAFSIIPYEKGCLFLFYLEQVVHGKFEMLTWLNSLYTDYQLKSYSFDDMKRHFTNHFAARLGMDALEAIDWKTWVCAPGLPPFDPSPLLRNELSEVSIELARKWLESAHDLSRLNASESDLAGFKPGQIVLFLDEVATSTTSLGEEVSECFESIYHLASSTNPEISYRAMNLMMKSGVRSVIPLVEGFLAVNGRGRYVIPLYAGLKRLDEKRAFEVYNQNEHIYQVMTKDAIERAFKN